MDGFPDEGYNGGGNANFDGGSGSNDGTRNFLRGANPLLGSSVYEGFTDPAPPFTGSSGVNPPRWGLDSLDLNDGGGWAAMDGYDADPRSDPAGSQMGPPPVRVPRRRNLTYEQPPSARFGGGGDGTGGRATSEAVGGDRVPRGHRGRASASAVDGGVRGRRRRRRGAVPQVDDDIVNPMHATPVGHIPVLFLTHRLSSIAHVYYCVRSICCSPHLSLFVGVKLFLMKSFRLGTIGGTGQSPI